MMPSTTEQEALFAALASKETKLAKIYRGGLCVLYDEQNPSRLELAAHSMRELIEKCALLIGGEVLSTGDSMKNRLVTVRKAFDMVNKGQSFRENSPVPLEGQLALIEELRKFFKWQDNNRPKFAKRVAETLAELSGPGQALPVDYAYSEVAGWMKADEYFKTVAHNRGTTVDHEEFLRHMMFIENVLLRRLRPRAIPALEVLDALIKEGEQVTDELVDRALELVAESGGNYEYFFAKLTSPDWIAPLQRKGRFSHPPQAILHETYIRHPEWPEGSYLARMAPLAPKAVFDAIDRATYKSDNHYVHQIILEIAAELPAEYAGQIATDEAQWAVKQTGFVGLYSQRLAPVLLKLATEGHSDAALRLLAPILEIEAPPNRRPDSELMIDGRPFRSSVHPIGRIDFWDIQRLLSSVSAALAESAPANFLNLLSDKLDKAIHIQDNGRVNTEDYSTIWRPRIDSVRFGDVIDTLVSAVRDAGVQVVRKHGPNTVLEVFKKHEWPVFQRLTYYVLAQSDNLEAEFVNGIVLHQPLYDNPKANPEFNDFLSKVAGKLPAEICNELLAVVDRGPDLGRYTKFPDEQKEGRGDYERRIVDRWRLEWLSVLKEIIGEERKQVLKTLLNEYGPPKPAFSSGVFAVGHTSAITLEELRQLSLPELVSYLKEWVPAPQTHPNMPSRAGIGQELQALVSEDPALFSDNLGSFQLLDLHPTYLRSILDAFTAALKGERQFDPYKVAATIEWLLSNTNKVGFEPYNWDEDPGWSWAHMSSARFLSELFLHSEGLDASRHLEFWPALKLIAGNPSPSEADEEEYRRREDVGMLALNSIRPVGLEAVMRYARWLKLSATDTNDLKVDSDEMPELFRLLASHLDPKVDNSVAVREMYGMQFQLLAWLDQEWLEAQLPALFPEKPLRVLDRFAWNAYLGFSRAISALLPAMRFRYMRATNSLQAGKTEVHNSEHSLGNHLTLYYAWGAIDLDDELLSAFFAKASPVLQAQTIGDVGWQLGQEAENLDPKIEARLMALWEHRLAEGVTRTSANRKEMGSFGWWFASKKFPNEWSIKQLMQVVDTFRYVNPDFAVVERLAQLAPEYPFEAVHCLGVIFEEDREGWAIHGWGTHPQDIIREALEGSPESRAEADRVINLFVSRGHRGFRQLMER